MESLLAFLGGFIGVFALVIAYQAARPAPLRSQRTSPRRARCCKEAPSRIVDIIDAQFANGEHLAHAQSVEGTHAETFLGGNIFRGNLKVSSQDTPGGTRCLGTVATSRPTGLISVQWSANASAELNTQSTKEVSPNDVGLQSVRPALAYKMMCRGLTSSITSLKKFAMSPKSVLNASKTQSSGHDFAANINRPQLNPAP
ncbi:Uncharacterised protein [Mycobacteroides abscessus subsp. massiliense]|nr:Uncharacterised protein [Mycobacteroides abscessus subsp. massiliense]